MRIALLCLWLAARAGAQPASDLMQSAIFAQETAGDLDRAIRLYRQILGSGADLRLYAAQAQYRLGVCLLRKGDAAAAMAAFTTLIRNYPEERELVARARESMPQGGNLLPAPWSETEVAEYRWNIPNVDDGWSLTRIAPAADKNHLSIQMNLYSPGLYTTLVEVERAGMRPVQATYRPSRNDDRTTIVSLAVPGGEEKVVHQATFVGLARHNGSPDAYEYGELLYLFRRMPLYTGWAETIPVIGPDSKRSEVRASVVAVETVTVPAGTFKCFKVQLANDPKVAPPRYSAAGTDWQIYGVGQWLWYAVDGARPLVKMQVASFTGELTSLRTREQLGPSSFRDPAVGFSFTVPPGWIYHARLGFNGPATSVDLLDPELQVLVTISFKSKKTAPQDIDQELVAGALVEQANRPGLVTRGALEHGQTGGHRSISWIGERTGPEGKTVRWTTWIQSEATRGSVAVGVPAQDFDRFRVRLQAIIDSFRMP